MNIEMIAKHLTLEINKFVNDVEKDRFKDRKQRLTVHISVDLIDRLKNAVYWSPGVTLAAIAEEYLSKGVDALEKKNGKPFPPRKEELKGGRPVK